MPSALEISGPRPAPAASDNEEVRICLEQWATREGLLYGRERGQELARGLRGHLAQLRDPTQIVRIDFVGVTRASLPLLSELFAGMYPFGHIDGHPVRLLGMVEPVARAVQSLFGASVGGLAGEADRSAEPLDAYDRPGLNRRVPLELFVDREGVLSSIAVGWEAGALIEAQAAAAREGQPLTLDFRDVNDLTASFAGEGLIDPLERFSPRRPFVIANANPAIERLVAATLQPGQRATLLNADEPPRSLGGSAQTRQDEVKALADAMSPFAVSDLTRILGISAEAANYHVRRLVEVGFLDRERIGSGKGEPYRYFVADGPPNGSARTA